MKDLCCSCGKYEEVNYVDGEPFCKECFKYFSNKWSNKEWDED